MAIIIRLLVAGVSTIAICGVADAQHTPGSYAAWARIAPPLLRGRVTAGFTLVTGLLGSGLGPIAVTLTTDRVFHDESKVGMSIAVVVSLALPAVALLLLTGRGALRRHSAQEVQTIE